MSIQNSKWYFLCNFETNTALDLVQIPEVWNNVTGMANLEDGALADLSWANNPNYGFLPVVTAAGHNIDSTSIANVLDLCRPAVMVWLRGMRDVLLSATDLVMLPDRLNAFNAIQRKRIAEYRQALRDITSQDVFNAVWPAIPPELDFLRGINTDDIVRPSSQFLAALTDAYPEQTLEEKQADAWLLIHDERERRKSGGIKVNIDGTDYWFWSTEPSRLHYAVLEIKAAAGGWSDDTFIDNWKTMNGVFVPFTVAILHQLTDTGMAAEKQLFAIAEAHRQAMLAAADPLAYDFTTGWPMTYKEYVASTTP